VVWSIPQQIALEVPRKNVINICEEVSDELDKDRDPDDEAHEGAPNAAGASVDKVITAVHMPEAVYCDNLTDLPQMVHREASISLGDIGLEHDEADMRPMNGTDPTKSVAQLVEVVEGHGDFVPRDEKMAWRFGRRRAGRSRFRAWARLRSGCRACPGEGRVQTRGRRDFFVTL
jgi:hypothetical protein